VVERFFDEREAGEVGVREVHAAHRLRGAPQVVAPHEAGPRPHHGVPPEHHVGALQQIRQVGVRRAQVGEGAVLVQVTANST